MISACHSIRESTNCRLSKPFCITDIVTFRNDFLFCILVEAKEAKYDKFVLTVFDLISEVRLTL